MSDDSRQAAIHEAAHMVAAWEKCLRVESATVVPDPETEKVSGVFIPLDERMMYTDWVETDGYLHAYLVATFAGEAAVEAFTGITMETIDFGFVDETVTPDSDIRCAADAVLALAGTEEEDQNRVCQRAFQEARMIVSVRWGQIHRVADALEYYGDLDERGCRDVLESAFA